MEINEAKSFVDDRLRPNLEALEAMPDENMREQATNAVLESTIAQDARQAFISELYRSIGDLSTVKQVELVTEDEKIDESQGDDKYKMALDFVNSDTYCEPIFHTSLKTFTSKENIDTSTDHAQNLLDQIISIEKQAKLQSEGLGQKKLARLKSRTDAKIEKIITTPPEGYEGEHIALYPYLFSGVINSISLLLNETIQSEGEKSEDAKFIRTIALKLLGSGEQFLYDNADQLQQDTEFVGQLLTTYTDELSASNEYLGPAGHLLRGYFKSVNTPEKAVSRHKSIYEAMIMYHENSLMLQNAAKVIMHFPSFFENIEHVENYLNYITFAKDNLVETKDNLDAVIAMGYQFIIFNLSTPSNSVIPIKRTEELTKLRRSQIESVADSLIEKYGYSWEEINNNSELENIILENARIEDTGSQPYRNVLRNYIYEKLLSEEISEDPEYSKIFNRLIQEQSEINELVSKYLETFGYSIFDASKHNVIAVDSDYVLDIIWDKNSDTTDTEVMAKLYKQRMDSILRAVEAFKTDAEGWISKYKEFNKSDELLKNFGHYPYEMNLGEETDFTLLLRPRNLYDDDVLMDNPLNDFVVGDFKTSEPLPSVIESKNHIDQYRTRFVPKRGVQVVISDKAVLDSGLSKLILRSGGSGRIIIEATIHGKQRLMQMKDGIFYTKYGLRVAGGIASEIRGGKFMDYCMNALSEWMCRPTMETSEGTIEEGKDGPIKGGYFAYLPVVEGRKYQRSDEQWSLCVEEKGLDLDEESKRREELDESGKRRNSTYVREHPDDGAHLDPLKIYL